MAEPNRHPWEHEHRFHGRFLPDLPEPCTAALDVDSAVLGSRTCTGDGDQNRRVGQVDDPGPRTPARRVVRVGAVVHVTSHPRSAFVAQLLTHLEAVGFTGAPRWLGRSDDGDDLLSFVEGEVLGDPPYDLADDQLTAASELIRQFHDAAAGSALSGDAETVCHGDLGPHNTVFREGRPVALIDWDADVRPGRRAVDVADAVWSFTDLTSRDVPVAEQARRVAVMCDAYPGMSPALVVSELTAQFDRARARHLRAGRPGPQAVFDDLLAWLDRHGPAIAAGR